MKITFTAKIVFEPTGNRIPTIKDAITTWAELNAEVELIEGIGNEPTIIITEIERKK